MSPSPETRPSLLVRLADRDDQAAWLEFAQVYTPVIQRLALRRGLQPADADDLTQQVLTAVSKAIGRWQTDPTRALSHLAAPSGAESSSSMRLAVPRQIGPRATPAC